MSVNDEAFKLTDDEWAKIRPLLIKPGEEPMKPGQLKLAIQRMQMQRLQDAVLLKVDEATGTTPVSRMQNALNNAQEPMNSHGKLAEVMDMLSTPIPNDADKDYLTRFGTAVKDMLGYPGKVGRGEEVAKVVWAEKHTMGHRLDPLVHIATTNAPVTKDQVPPDLRVDRELEDGTKISHVSLRIVGQPRGVIARLEDEKTAKWSQSA